MAGAALNMMAYCAFKDLRKGTAQTIIAVLAMAEFVLASSSTFGASIHLVYGTKNNSADNMQIQGFVAMRMLGCSFTWTSVLAVHSLLVTGCTRSTWPHKLMPLYNMVAWLVPLAYTLPMLLGKLGHNLTWTCFMRSGENICETQWDIEELVTVVCIFMGYSCVLYSLRIGENRT